MIPDWQLPSGVDRGLHDYLRSAEMVRGYDAMMAISPLAALDCAFCERHFPTPGKLLDLVGVPHQMDTRWDPKTARPPMKLSCLWTPQSLP